MAELRLEGCAPEPLMSYLKAVGVLRLVAEQADEDVRGCWCDGGFVLHTKLDEDALIRFFLERYRPTPIIAPTRRAGWRLTKPAIQEIKSPITSAQVFRVPCAIAFACNRQLLNRELQRSMRRRNLRPRPRALL